MRKITKLISLLRTLRSQLYQIALSNEEGVVIASNISQTLNDICKTLVPHCDVTIRTGVPIHPKRGSSTWQAYTGATK